MYLSEFDRTIDIWINELEKYQLSDLAIKPAPRSWSLGQLYFHLISNTRFFIEQIRSCISSNENSMKSATRDGLQMLKQNDFLNVLIEGPDTHVDIPQPRNKEDLISGMVQLKKEVLELAPALSSKHFNGKTKHPGLGYFGADEWLQFAEMHLRHHLRQKQRIDSFLKSLK